MAFSWGRAGEALDVNGSTDSFADAAGGGPRGFKPHRSLDVPGV